MKYYLQILVFNIGVLVAILWSQRETAHYYRHLHLEKIMDARYVPNFIISEILSSLKQPTNYGTPSNERIGYKLPK